MVSGVRAGQYVHLRTVEPGGLPVRRPLPIATVKHDLERFTVVACLFFDIHGQRILATRHRQVHIGQQFGIAFALWLRPELLGHEIAKAAPMLPLLFLALFGANLTTHLDALGFLPGWQRRVVTSRSA